jgi:hypothetical protein
VAQETATELVVQVVDEPDPFQLETRHSPTNGRFQIRVDGRWRQSRWWTTHCCSRECNWKGPELAFLGLTHQDGSTVFWGQCPRCGWETRTYWVGYQEPRPAGGRGHGHLRGRRASWGY